MAGGAHFFVVRDRVEVRAPIELCFALSTNLSVVEAVLKMRLVGGRLEGAVDGGDTVLWRGWKWGMPHKHETLIEEFRPPFFFRDRMIDGRFASFEHDHSLKRSRDGTLLEDELRFRLRWGVAGVAIGRGVVLPHVRDLMRRRFALIRELAEGEGWRQYVPPALVESLRPDEEAAMRSIRSV